MESLDRAIYHVLTDNGVTPIVLAGYMKKLGPLTHYKGRIPNMAARVLQYEHELFVDTLVKISEGQIVL